MNVEDAAKLLQAQSMQDGRKPSDGQIVVWADSLQDLSYDVALAAMRELWRESTEYMTPALIRRQARAQRSRAELVARRERALAEGQAVRACGLCDEHGYRLPHVRVVCTHRPVREVGAAARLRLALERGSDTSQ